jgi:predicted DNA-binding transcriptional regulator AlpA
MDHRILTTKQAAQRFGLSESTLEAWRCRGGGPVFVKFGKAVRYREPDLDVFEESCQRQNTGQVVGLIKPWTIAEN